MEYRLEVDSIGELAIPVKSYYGIQTLRAYNNFNISNRGLNKNFIISMAEVKKSAMILNNKLGYIDDLVANACIEAADEIIKGKLHNQFIVDSIQGGAGTSMNMNANEVIANRALEILGHEKGSYDIVNPNDHINFAQSTNDVIPTAGKITAIKLLDDAIKKLEKLQKAFVDKSKEFENIVKMGRTQLQDAVPITLGQEFFAYSLAVERDIKRFKEAKKEMAFVNIGGTAIGTGINADEKFISEIIEVLNSVTNLDLKHNKDLIDGTQNLDCFVYVSSIIKTCATNLSKMSNDLRLMSSGPRAGLSEINLPAKQNGSSIMPGKINPVIPEVINQIAFNIIGNDVTINFAAESGQLELNAFEPIIFYKLFESLVTLINGVDTFIINCLIGITANEKNCEFLVNNSVGVVTALCPVLGYKKSAELAKEAINTNKSIREIVIEQNVLTKEEYDKIICPKNLTRPGIIRK